MINQTDVMKAVSLFSSAGIAEIFLEDMGVSVITANEIIKERADLYRSVYSNSKMITGDIKDSKTFSKILEASEEQIDLLMASPPCQGMSMAGKGRNVNKMLEDERNYLIYDILKFIELKKPRYVLIENVPNLIKLKLPYKGELKNVLEILSIQFQSKYNIEADILNTVDYGVPQERKRAIIKMYLKGSNWPWPAKQQRRSTVRETIAHLPSLESGESSTIKWHFARKHVDRHIRWMKNTPTGKSAFENKIHFPQKKNGDIIKGYNTTYRRIEWDKPAPTITIRNDAISSQRNVHPGRKKNDGTYSDARVLTPLELMLLSSIPQNWEIPNNTPESLIRKTIGECIPPLLIKELIKDI